MTLVQRAGSKIIILLMVTFGTTISSSLQTEVATFGFMLLALAMVKSPVDTGRFRAAWQINRRKATGSLAGIEISNNVDYAGPIEYGSPVGQNPWPSAQEKTVEMDGRVYSKQAPGGVLTPVLPEETKKLAEALLTGIMR